MSTASAFARNERGRADQARRVVSAPLVAVNSPFQFN